MKTINAVLIKPVRIYRDNETSVDKTATTVWNLLVGRRLTDWLRCKDLQDA